MEPKTSQKTVEAQLAVDIDVYRSSKDVTK
jgi:hypothetical protein